MGGILKAFLKRTMGWAAVAIAVLVFLAIAVPLRFPLVAVGTRTEKEPAVRREYALYSADSSAVFTEDPNVKESLFIKGETVIFTRKSDGEIAEEIEKILRMYGAEIRFEERTEKSVSYYCYSSAIGGYRAEVLQGEKINLHLVRGEGVLRVGSPLVYGGY